MLVILQKRPFDRGYVVIVCRGSTRSSSGASARRFRSRRTAACSRLTAGKAIGSLLVAQPFTKDEYFQPRPSAASFDGTAGLVGFGLPTMRYAIASRGLSGRWRPMLTAPNKGSPSRPTWRLGSRPTSAGGNPHIVGQWADAHNSSLRAG